MLMDAFHSDPFWEELGGRCLSCTACASACPTCYCFDIRDVRTPDGKHGSRERVWDCCTNPQFAVVAGGHNFRPDGATACAIACITSSTAFLPRTTACSAWDAGAACALARPTSIPSRC